jgi:hypothetical protein
MEAPSAITAASAVVETILSNLDAITEAPNLSSCGEQGANVTFTATP